MTELEKAARQALEALQDPLSPTKRVNAITALRRALEQQPKRPQNCGTGYCSCIECVMEPEQQEDLYDLAVKADNGGQP